MYSPNFSRSEIWKYENLNNQNYLNHCHLLGMFGSYVEKKNYKIWSTVAELYLSACIKWKDMMIARAGCLQVYITKAERNYHSLMQCFKMGIITVSYRERETL